ncbi:hypothetical protein C1X05_14990 [Laceyella sacchari]|uniref:cAMP-binding domain of CRP or a regulatory subunit of cAMP-dependent protein kinases n=1 Tax=Laceyella tengchongensis TaxID=574699 RepID=A0AA45WPI9_9BACL|nr:Crp/Fnr family transcriptional regulator [Laceyella tengchongensis]AUS10005.1 hypothetical protein C1X05_14990 [Laceyella sacchari]SMP22111.1 cAMP-binding domain of CRP or a regulatory subunit of cAMP-dependent protein kinases [Laceyella tengchongensis]
MEKAIQTFLSQCPNDQWIEHHPVQMEPEKVYIIQVGYGTLWETKEDGNHVLLDVLQEGSIFEVPFIPDRTCEFHPHSPVQVSICDWREVLHSPIAASVIAELRKYWTRVQTLQMIKHNKFVEDRLIQFLFFLAQPFQSKTNEHQLALPFPITHEELAAAILSTRATITRCLSQLRRECKIDYFQKQGKRYILLTNRFIHSLMSTQPEICLAKLTPSTNISKAKRIS